jgi:hypothetical protein
MFLSSKMDYRPINYAKNINPTRCPKIENERHKAQNILYKLRDLAIIEPTRNILYSFIRLYHNSSEHIKDYLIYEDPTIFRAIRVLLSPGPLNDYPRMNDTMVLRSYKNNIFVEDYYPEEFLISPTGKYCSLRLKDLK